MRNIILSFFILVIFSNVKAASFQDANNNSPKPVGYVSVTQPTVLFEHVETSHIPYIAIINDIVRDEAKDIKYPYEDGKYHCIITYFDIYIDNSDQSLKKILSENDKEGLIKGSAYFIAYIKDMIKHLILHHMHKYDFEKNTCDNMRKLIKDLNDLIYDEIDNKLKQDLIKYERRPENEKFHKKAKEYLKLLVNNSSMKIKGYFIKTREDGTNMDLCKNESLYFEMGMRKHKGYYKHKFKSLEPEVAELVSNLIRKP
ncbi:fam-d protein [Plasmodium vinckei brucechwatti]|uniref:Fam-d protein n=1 Tax=Plasmodium vinckei brucechwatti TaxID=119398 RepID=A0A6V7S4A2_PLAVN|nr:fam-d protein [Plasmodium vinckei brucechwatti]